MQYRVKEYERKRWYEREHTPYAADRKLVEEYAHWVKEIDWKLFGTFTFAWRVSDQQAEKIFAAFIDRLERTLKADVGFVRGDEKRPSGCGRPACGRHYHALLASAAPMEAAAVEWLWMSMAGNRSYDAGAKVEPYDPARNGAEYLMKFINKVDGDWAFRKLQLFHPEVAKLGIKPIVVVPIGNACIPDEIRNNQLSLVVIKYMKDHPDKLTTHAALLAIAAIKTEWECQ
jgi:Ssp1 endopeptidase immunity protein Rap1a